jgi:stress-induced-phosphoprotein 1
MTAGDWKERGNTALQSGLHTEAITAYTQAIALDGNQHTFYSNRSVAYLSYDNPSEALNDAETCIAMNPSWPKGWLRKGAALKGLGLYDEAIAAYKEGLGRDPDNAALQSGLEDAEAEDEEMEEHRQEEDEEEDEEDEVDRI